MDKLGLDEKGTVVLSNGSQDKHLPSSDSWLKLAKSMKVPASCCVVIASSSRACKAALSAGMRCVALPDKFTSFQDFGGADFVLESLDGDVAGRIIGLLDF
jgi:beta-phosphoglucomutase-like phosphatase (HAD superfamily)